MTKKSKHPGTTPCQFKPIADSELVIGLVGATGSPFLDVSKILRERLEQFSYSVQEIRVSADVLPNLGDLPDIGPKDEYGRINALMDAGNTARQRTGDNAILALGAAARINEGRDQKKGEPQFRPRHAYIINSLKHPEEVFKLRQIYNEGFYLLGIHCGSDTRKRVLIKHRRMTKAQAGEIMARDEDEAKPFGQRTRDTFHMADYFVQADDMTKAAPGIKRFLDILFGDLHKTPTFDEFAMYMAFAASARSGDLSRQVGAIIAQEEEIIATGANDCPKFGGGLYWSSKDAKTGEIPIPEGRDCARGYDSNHAEKESIFDSVKNEILKEVGNFDESQLLKALRQSKIKDITEYGRVVHAEMEALLSCARNNISCRNATLYGTTFPCHNCAKHIIAAGIQRVVYVEPYPKSKAADFHQDSMILGFRDEHIAAKKVCFEPFVGIGPRRFVDLFSMGLGSGYPLDRKTSDGKARSWSEEDAILRLQMQPYDYLDREMTALRQFLQAGKSK